MRISNPITALHPRQLSCFLANFIIPLFEGVDMDTDLVWLPWRSSLLAFFRIGSKILRSGCNVNIPNCQCPGWEDIYHRYLSRQQRIYLANLAHLIFKVILWIYWNIVLKHIYWILRLLISLFNTSSRSINRTSLPSKRTGY